MLLSLLLLLLSPVGEDTEGQHTTILLLKKAQLLFGRIPASMSWYTDWQSLRSWHVPDTPLLGSHAPSAWPQHKIALYFQTIFIRAVESYPAPTDSETRCHMGTTTVEWCTLKDGKWAAASCGIEAIHCTRVPWRLRILRNQPDWWFSMRALRVHCYLGCFELLPPNF